MFEKGEYIVYGHHGICRIEDITHLTMSGADREKLYYVLAPQNTKGSRIYYPTDRENRNARRLMSREEAQGLLADIPKIGTIRVGTDKLREDAYKKALYSGDAQQWVAVIKTLYLRKKERAAQGKRMAAVDERYLKLTEEALYGELTFVTGREKAELENVFAESMEKLTAV